MRERERFNVKIIKCALDTYWYNGKIGEIFEVYEHSRESYSLISSMYLIQKCDCVIANKFRLEIDRILDI